MSSTVTSVKVPCVTGVLSFTVESGDGQLKIREVNGAEILRLTLDLERGFVVSVDRGVVIEYRSLRAE